MVSTFQRYYGWRQLGISQFTTDWSGGNRFVPPELPHALEGCVDVAVVDQHLACVLLPLWVVGVVVPSDVKFHTFISFSLLFCSQCQTLSITLTMRTSLKDVHCPGTSSLHVRDVPTGLPRYF